MMLEAFQDVFEELVVMEVEPTPEILKRYQIPVLAVIRVKDFKNTVSWRAQALAVTTETALFDAGMKPLLRFESRGVSDAVRVFAKKGGPEVNLNAAIENNALAVVQSVQDFLRSDHGKESVSA